MTNSGDEHTDECDTSIDQQVIPNGQGITINWSWSIFHSSDGNASNGTLSTTNMALPLPLDVGTQLQHNNFKKGRPILEQHWIFGSLSKNSVGEEELFFSEGFLEHMTSNKL